MKPDWKDAPEWANWLAMDADGRWWWYEACPHKGGSQWRGGERIEEVLPSIFWENSLEPRP